MMKKWINNQHLTVEHTMLSRISHKFLSKKSRKDNQIKHKQRTNF